MADTAYLSLCALFARLSDLSDATSLLHWDMSTMMPAGCAEARANQLATLKTLAHQLLTAPEVADLLARAESDAAGLAPWDRANLAEMRRDWIHAAALPGDLVEATSRATSACEMAWRQARPASDFALVKGRLETLLGLVREGAVIKGEQLGCPPWEALLDQYEPGGSAAEIERVFGDLEAFLPGFLAEVMERQGPPPPLPAGPFPPDRQRQVALRFMAVLGFDFHHGRLDTSFHPFCGGTRDDVRVTTRYDPDDFSSSLMSVLHETGHALYDFGLPAAWARQPVGRARGMSVHESQSLLIEMQACRSRQFLGFAAPLLAEAYGGEGPAWSAESLHRRAIRVKPDFIRVDADEVTYPAHVILRTRLEQALVGGGLAVADLPEAWNQGMRDLLGITPPDDRRGCLQDIHWYDGAWGYFPTYTLGAMTAAQLFDAARRDEPDILPGLARGDFAPLVDWLRRQVHGHASSLSTADLLTRATGRPLDAAVFKAHLVQRYSG